MKNIELTEDHKSKLLEMCKELFPEIKSIVLQENLGILTFDQLQQIHWLEFCLCYLVDKVFNEDKEESRMSNQDYYMGGLIYRNKSQNPIDILYEEFKKLK